MAEGAGAIAVEANFRRDSGESFRVTFRAAHWEHLGPKSFNLAELPPAKQSCGRGATLKLKNFPGLAEFVTVIPFRFRARLRRNLAGVLRQTRTIPILEAGSSGAPKGPAARAPAI